MRLVFVSSTFKDMQFERDALNIRLAPRINDFLLQYGEAVRFGDLRWGVNTSELEDIESSKKVLKVCLDEIDNAKPYMIVFIGERYGWIPSSSLLDEAMKMKDINDVPNDISVTNLEIEYGALLNPDYEGRILFYFRDPIDTSKMSEEDRKIYESESPLHKEKLEALKKRIQELYPDYVRHYNVQYDEKSKSLVGLEDLMNQIYDDLTRIFDIDYKYLNSLPSYKRAIMNSEVYFENFYKYAYFRDFLKDPYTYNEELRENYSDGRYEDIPCLRYVYADPGMGRKTTIACLYKLAKDENPDYVLPFVFGLDKYTADKQALIETLISFYEEKLQYKHYKSKNIYTLVDLIKYNDQHDKKRFQIFIMNHHREIISFLKQLESEIKVMYYTTFYIMGSTEDKEYVPFLLFYGHNNSIQLEELKDSEKIQIIKNICKYKHKELSDVVINAIIDKSESGVPLYLSLVVERLLMLDSEDFQNIRHLGDGMDAINNYMISIVEDLGEDIISITEEIFKELAERINFDLVMRILFLASHDCSLDIDQYHDFFEFTDFPYNELDFSLLINSVPSLFMPVLFYNQLAFAYEAANNAARNLSEHYIIDTYYNKYIAFLSGHNYLDSLKKLIVYRNNRDYYNYLEVFASLLREKEMKNDSEILVESFINLMDNLVLLEKEKDDDFGNKFVIYTLDRIIDDDIPDRDNLLSVIFYPYVFDIESEDAIKRSVTGLWKIMQHINERAKDPKVQAKRNFHLVAGLLEFLITGVTNADYHWQLDGDDSDLFEKDYHILEKSFDNSIHDEEVNNAHILYRYYMMFNDRAMLARVVLFMTDEHQINYMQRFLMGFVNKHLRVKELDAMIENDDYVLWIQRQGIYVVIALFYNLLLTKYFRDEKSFSIELEHYLHVATEILHNDFFAPSRSTIVERYYRGLLFESFSNLLRTEDDKVEEMTHYCLCDWLKIRCKELCGQDVLNTAAIKTFVSVLLQDDDNDIEDEDFFFIYPMLYKCIERHFDYETWMSAVTLLICTNAIYEYEASNEFLYLVSLFREHRDDELPVLMALCSVITLRHRDIYDDELIDDTYRLFFDDFDIEDEHKYAEWKDRYLNMVESAKDDDEDN